MLKMSKFINKIKQSINSYSSQRDDLKLAKISSNRRGSRKTLKIKIKDLGNGKW